MLHNVMLIIFVVSVSMYMHVAKLLAVQWKSCTSTLTSLAVRIARDSTAFGEYYDHVDSECLQEWTS